MENKTTITIYRREDANTTPRGFGFAPTYHLMDAAPIDGDLVWYAPIEISIPVGYSIGRNYMDQPMIFDRNGIACEIIDHNGHPCIIDADAPQLHYIRLDA